MLTDRIREAVLNITLQAVTSVATDVEKNLEQYLQLEHNNRIIRSQLELMLQNIRYGKKNLIPICQDTGIPNFFLQVGSKFPIISDFRDLILDVLRDLTLQFKLRPNSVDPITQQNQGVNGGENMPPIYLEIQPNRDDLIITILPKGGGAENISSLFMLSSSTGFNSIIPKIKETIQKAGGMPCPPVILGIGLGGDASKAMFLAKKALLRPLGSRNSRLEVAELEKELLTQVNGLNVGVMGLGGGCTCLDVRIEWAMRHPASYPLGLIVQCYSHRIASCRISAKGTVEYGKLDDKFNFMNEEVSRND